MTAKQRIAKAEEAIKKNGKSGAACSTIVRLNDNGAVSADGVIMPLTEWEKLQPHDVQIVRVGIDMDKM
jgi:hypothetical protein